MAEQGFRTQGKITAPGELAFVNEMQQEFQRVLTLQETFHIDGPDLQHPVLYMESQNIDMVTFEDSVDPELISNPVLPPDPDDELFQKSLQSELIVPLPQRLARNLIDGILGRVQGPIRRQSACLGYEPETVSGLFEN
jgi:aspartate-semialdehyde dehydrogenase